MALWNPSLHPRGALGRFVRAGTKKERKSAKKAIAANLAVGGVYAVGLVGASAISGAKVSVMARAAANRTNSAAAATRGLAAGLQAARPRGGVYGITSLKGRRV